MFDFRTDSRKQGFWKMKHKETITRCIMWIVTLTSNARVNLSIRLHDNRKRFHCAPAEIRLNQLPGGCLFGEFFFYVYYNRRTKRGKNWFHKVNTVEMCHSKQTYIYVSFGRELHLSLKFPPDFICSLSIRTDMRHPPFAFSFPTKCI